MGPKGDLHQVLCSITAALSTVSKTFLCKIFLWTREIGMVNNLICILDTQNNLVCYISGRGKSSIYFFRFIVHDDKRSFINFTVGATLFMLLIFTVFWFNPF